jgi:drug/metabolite transporter (DMT)-like permease
MEPGVAAAVLAAALLHASWHALVKSSGDQIVALAGMNVVSGAASLVVIFFVPPPSPLVLAIIAGSVLLHVGYKIALAELYRGADLALAYPIARGLTPVMATVIAWLVLHELPDGPRLAGIALISFGILGLVYERAVRQIGARLLLAALVAGTAVAAYSAVDAYGVRLAGDWLSFTAWLITCDAGTFVAYCLLTRPGAARAWRADWERILASGVLGLVSFGVFLWALGRAQVGAVSALRETSVMLAAMLGVLVLRERPSRARFVSAFLVTAGAMLIALYP